MAEETGLIGEIGAAILRDSLAQLARWRAAELPFAECHSAVNVGTPSGRRPGVRTTGRRGARPRRGIPADSLWLEITETALLADVEGGDRRAAQPAQPRAAPRRRRLRHRLLVADLPQAVPGRGDQDRPQRSSPVSGSTAEDTTIVEAVVNLGHSLGIGVVAEGVETPLQLARLRAIGLRPRPGLPVRPAPPGVDRRVRERVSTPTRDRCGATERSAELGPAGRRRALRRATMRGAPVVAHDCRTKNRSPVRASER